jgi:hypothetical protein
MSPGNDNHVDRTAATTPTEGVLPSLSRQAKTAVRPAPERNVMDTLLGKNNLASFDAGGADPYNATGRQFRR